ATIRKWINDFRTKIDESYMDFAKKQIKAYNSSFYKNDPNDLSLEYPDRKALPDSDNDGMPDEWERKNGLNCNDASDANAVDLSSVFTGIEGYTNIEVYINAMADSIVTLLWKPERIALLGTSWNNGCGLMVYPNPFTNRVNIPAISGLGAERKDINIGVYNINGGLVKRLPNCRYGLVWDGLDNTGRELGAGMYYFYCLSIT
ncbi:MAG: hypothetical protein ABIA63_08670, partial [bacterium]